MQTNQQSHQGRTAANNFEKQKQQTSTIPQNQFQDKNKKWQQIIKSQQNQTQIPELLKQQSFQSSNQNQQYLRQRKMMQQAIQLGKQNLIKKQYIPASKQLSKALMAFQFIMKNHVSSQTINKQQIKSMMISSIIPTYNNLALCHLKLKNYPLVLSFCNQVLGQDSDNVKARYRRAVANKQLKNIQDAVTDFQMVNKLDNQMSSQCQRQIRECKQIETNIKKRRKLAAQKFLSGYQRQDQQKQKQPLISKKQELQEIINKFKEQQEKQNSCIKWIRQTCSKFFKIVSKLKNKKE